MKNLFIGKYLVIALCLLSVQSLIAKDIYLSVNGADTNNGLSESGAVATLTKALSLIEDGDNIRVSGIIDVSKEVSGSCYTANGVFDYWRFSFDFRFYG